MQGAGGIGNAGKMAVNSAAVTGGAVGADGAIANTKDAKEAQTAAKFGEVLNKIQAQYGAKAEKPREIKKQLGKDDFLRIMITQMKNQDPTNPFKAEQMAAEMAQFTSVEQLQNVNSNLNKMAGQNQPLERMAMTNLIGKTVTIDKERFAHVEGQNESLVYTLPKEAKEVKIAIIDEHGETVLEKDLGAQKSGENTFTWDGLKSNTLAAKNGNFLFKVDAKDEKGARVQTGGIGQARVVGVSFEAGGDPVFLVGDHLHQTKVGFKSIVRIEDQGAAPAPAPGLGDAPGTGAPSAASTAPAGLISFQKGVGSSTLDAASLAPEVTAALARASQSSAGAAAPSAPAQAKPEGFPNGLRDDDAAKSSVSPTQQGAGRI